ncbi:MAG: hypothetical protein KME59_01330 [Trichormus sp. ATA11-4-KO1]|jgi:hypothetical protein|nr:hypothetical protein [Trichormus sp. ATA11-4-KO1]
MADLETLVNELPKLVPSLKLTIGNSHEIMQQILLINNIREQLRNIQKNIAQELRLVKSHKTTVNTLPRLGTVASLFLNDVYFGDTNINTKTRYITAKFGHSKTELSINYLQSKIDAWIEWGDFLHVISADILSDYQLVSQLSSDINHSSLSIKLQELNESLKINLTFSKPKILQQQVLQISNAQEELLIVQQRLNYIINTIKNSHSLLTILLGISTFCGKSGFTLEWLDDNQELIIFSDGKFQELTDILNDCELFQQEIETLMVKINNLTQQVEKYQRNVDQITQQEPVSNHPINLIPKFASQKGFHATFIIASSLVVLSFGGWMSKNQIPHLQQVILRSNQEASASANFKSALKLGMEASSLVQNSPHPLIVWQQAKAKWQQAIDLLTSIPEGTSVYPQAKSKLLRYRLNHTAISKRALTEQKAMANLQAAQKLAAEATFFVQNSPQSVLTLKQAKDKWHKAIKLLEGIPKSTSTYKQAQETLFSYKTNYASVIIKD